MGSFENHRISNNPFITEISKNNINNNGVIATNDENNLEDNPFDI